ncbi:MAG: thermonuclease family protein [Candidatus Omnitrophota bacterium]
MILLFICVLFFLSCSPSPDYSHIKVSEVIDGDTVRLSDGKLLRYIGIDTPEITRKENGRFIYDPAPFAQEAKELNRQLVENKFATIKFDLEKNDSYGRILGYCFVEDTFVNAKLIEEGFAVLSTQPPNISHVDLFVSLEEKARRKKAGLWGSYEVIDSDQAEKFINQIRTVRGRVLSTHKSKKAVYLNFGIDYRKDFTVVIFSNCWKTFEKEKVAPQKVYKNKVVEVTGRIREYNGPEIIVCLSYQIKVVDED